MFTYCSFDVIKNKLDCYRGKDCIDKFYKNMQQKQLTMKKRNDTITK